MTAIETCQIQLGMGPFSLKDITLSVPDGKMTAIVGPNGSGKSTLLKLLAQLLYPEQGELYVYEREAKKYKIKDYCKVVSMLPQHKFSMPDMTVREIVSFGRAPHKRFFEYRMTAEDDRTIDFAMEVTGTKKLEDRLFHTLSGGEQQKVRIAMVLAQKTNILLLDEPTTFLDIAHQFEIMEMLQKINRHYHITVVMVLHDLQQAAFYCHHLIAMKHGKIVACGNPSSILTPQFLKDVYDMDAKIKFEDGYPVIIPDIKKSQTGGIKNGDCDEYFAN